MFSKTLLLLDVETTGLLPQRDAIIEIAACVLSPNDLQEQSTFHTRVYTDATMSAAAQAVHGVRTEDLVDEPVLSEAISRFAAFAPTDTIICGHNVSFDIGFLKAAYAKTGTTYLFDYHALDIWSIAFFVLGTKGVRTPEYSLTGLCNLFSIPREKEHNALQDIRASAAILRHLHSVIGGDKIDTLGQFSLGDF